MASKTFFVEVSLQLKFRLECGAETVEEAEQSVATHVQGKVQEFLAETLEVDPDKVDLDITTHNLVIDAGLGTVVVKPTVG